MKQSAQRKHDLARFDDEIQRIEGNAEYWKECDPTMSEQFRTDARRLKILRAAMDKDEKRAARLIANLKPVLRGLIPVRLVAIGA